jgi:hypothetical protein
MASVLKNVEGRIVKRARPTGKKLDLKAFHEETMQRFPTIMKRLAE